MKPAELLALLASVPVLEVFSISRDVFSATLVYAPYRISLSKILSEHAMHSLKELCLNELDEAIH